MRTSGKPASAGRAQKSTQPKAELPPDTKPIRGVRTDPPNNPFQVGNKHALKHGGYGLQMSDSLAGSVNLGQVRTDGELWRH